VNPTGEWVMAITEKKMLKYALTGDMGLIESFSETEPITSMHLGENGEALVNLSTQEIHLWDFRDGGKVLRKFSGFKQVCLIILMNRDDMLYGVALVESTKRSCCLGLMII
jgi:hypothetical protein